MIAEDYLKAHGCSIAHYFGGEYGYNGMLAILFTLRNRVAEYGNWLGVLNYILDNGPAIRLVDPREPEFQKLLQTADQVFDNTAIDIITNGALYFFDSNHPTVTSDLWFSFNKERVAQVGGLTFYK